MKLSKQILLVVTLVVAFFIGGVVNHQSTPKAEPLKYSSSQIDTLIQHVEILSALNVQEFADGLIEQEEEIERLKAEIAKLKGKK